MLKTYIGTIANKLKAGSRVYLCPASLETVLIAKMLETQFGVLPSGFCDNDVRKQGRRLNSLPELHIFSFDEALADSAVEFFVVSPFHSAEIMGNLVFERNVPQSSIINYQPVERKKTCARFAQNWIIEDKHFVSCCIEGHKPRLDHDPFDVQQSVNYLDQTRKGFIDGNLPLPENCANCYRNKECYVFTSRKLNSFNFSFRGWCNYKCAYCSAHHPDLKNYNSKFSLEQYLIAFEARDMVNDVFSVLYAVGEPTLNGKRKALYDYCGKKLYFLDVFSNCSVFDESLFELAHKSPVILRKSFDAGTVETYAKIKGVNCYEKMIDNIWRYMKAPYLVLNPKYLFVPGVNDNETDVKRFVRMCSDLKVDFVTPVFSILDTKYKDSVHAKKMFKLLIDELTENNIFTANVDTLYSHEYHQQYAGSF